MDNTLLKKLAVQSVVLMLAVITLSYAHHNYQMAAIPGKSRMHLEALAASDKMLSNSNTLLSPSEINQLSSSEDSLENASKAPQTQNQALNEVMSNIDPDVLNKLGNRYIIIKKPQEVNTDINLKDVYINNTLEITLNSSQDISFNSYMIGRVNGEDMYVGDPVYKEIEKDNSSEDSNKPVTTRDYGNDPVHGITISSNFNNKTDSNCVKIILELDKVYAYIKYENDEYYLIALKNPKEIYNRIVVIDAGHGGKDSGALSNNKVYDEKNINLGILLQLKELLDKENIKVYYTRTGDNKVFLRPRVKLANEVDCDFFISIHNNANDASWPNGSEILYYNNDYHNIKNRNLANLFLGELKKKIPLCSRGLVEEEKKNVFILEKAKVPAILIEVGYMTNYHDMNYISKKDNQKVIARGIFNGIMKAYQKYPSTGNRKQETK